MEETFIYSVLVRWGHTLFGIAWIGLLYYFNFVQTEYVKVADPDAKSDVMKKLAPNALWWFRWAAFFTFVTGVTLLYYLQVLATTEIVLGSIMGTLNRSSNFLCISGDNGAEAERAKRRDEISPGISSLFKI